MDTIKEVLEFLDRHTGYTQDFEGLVQNPQWPRGWMSSYQIAQEADRFQFWSGLRSRIPQQTRIQLVDYYLKRAANDESSGWVNAEDQFMLNPGDADINNGKAVERKTDQRRRHGRVNCEMLSCQLGEVVNLSASGVMLQSKGNAENKTDDRIGLDLNCLDHKLHATARVAWIKQDEGFYQMGMEFVDLTPDQAERIRTLLPLAAAVQSVSGNVGSGSVTHWGK